MPNTNEKRIVGAAGRKFEKFEPVTGITEQEMEVMGEAMPTSEQLKKTLGLTAYMALAIAPGSGEYIAWKDYQHFTKESLKKAEEYKKLRGTGATRKEAGIGGLIGQRALQYLSAIGMVPMLGYVPRVAKTMLRHQITGAVQQAVKAGITATAPKAVRIPFVKVENPGTTSYQFDQIIPQSEFDTFMKEGGSSQKPWFGGDAKAKADRSGLEVSGPFHLDVDPNQYFPETMTNTKMVDEARIAERELVDQMRGKLPTRLTPETTGGKIADSMGPIRTEQFKPVFGLHSYEVLSDFVEQSGKGKVPRDPIKAAREWLKFDENNVVDPNYSGWFQQQNVKKQELLDSGIWDNLQDIVNKHGPDAPVEASQLMRTIQKSPVKHLQVQSYGYGQLKPGYRKLIISIEDKMKKMGATPVEKMIYKHFGKNSENIKKNIYGGYLKTVNDVDDIERGQRGLNRESWNALEEIGERTEDAIREFEYDIGTMLKGRTKFNLRTGTGFDHVKFNPHDRHLLKELSAITKTELNPTTQSFRPRQYSQPDYTYMGGEDYMEYVVRAPHNWGSKPKAYGAHFPDENPLFFMRTSKHTTPEGESVLVIHEVQGDLINDIMGSKKKNIKPKPMEPYPKSPDMAPLRAKRKELTKLRADLEQIRARMAGGVDLPVEEVERFSSLLQRQTNLTHDISQLSHPRNIIGKDIRERGIENIMPYTPLANNQMMNDTALKMAARIAADKNYDYVAIYPAKQHRGGEITGHSRNYGNEFGLDAHALHADPKQQANMRKSKAHLPTTAHKLSKIAGTETKTISVRAIPKIKGKEPKAYIGTPDRSGDSTIPFKYFADEEAAQKYLKEEFGEHIIDGFKIRRVEAAPPRIIDMFALKINERFKDPIPLYKHEGGVISLVEALDMYYG